MFYIVLHLTSLHIDHRLVKYDIFVPQHNTSQQNRYLLPTKVFKKSKLKNQSDRISGVTENNLTQLNMHDRAPDSNVRNRKQF